MLEKTSSVLLNNGVCFIVLEDVRPDLIFVNSRALFLLFSLLCTISNILKLKVAVFLPKMNLTSRKKRHLTFTVDHVVAVIPRVLQLGQKEREQLI